jgi:hypothetical protein
MHNALEVIFNTQLYTPCFFEPHILWLTNRFYICRSGSPMCSNCCGRLMTLLTKEPHVVIPKESKPPRGRSGLRARETSVTRSEEVGTRVPRPVCHRPLRRCMDRPRQGGPSVVA